MTRAIGATLALCLSLMWPAVASSGEAPTEAVARDVEAAFRGAMEMWAYREFWHLWEVSTSESRFALTQQEGRWRPQLPDFLGLSRYVFPLQPAMVPVILIAPCCPVRVLVPRSHRIILRP